MTSKRVVETGDHVAFTYDAAGNRISMTDESGSSVYSYDANRRLTSIRKDGAERVAYTYDAVGNIETMKDAAGYVTSYTYDRSNRMSTVSFGGQTTMYGYDANGNRVAVTYAGGVKETYAFDRSNRLVTLVNRKPNGDEISRYSYTYDDAGRQTSKTDSFGKTSYTYDPTGRITKVEAPGKTTLYGYDAAGNRQSLAETYTSSQPTGFADPSTGNSVSYLVKKSEYLYSAANELIRVVERLSDGDGEWVLQKTISYLYDANGNELRQKTEFLHPHNRTMRQVTGGSPHGESIEAGIDTVVESVANEYDGFNRLKRSERLKSGERIEVSFVYDGDGLRTQKTTRSSKDGYKPKVTAYLYDRQHVILETDAEGEMATRYLRGINYIARTEGDGKTSYFLYNGHGDVVQTVSAEGEVENRYDYDIFGMPTLTMESYANAILYAGEFFDTETGLYYLRARYYNPHTGRFISEDSYWGEDRVSLSLNLYTYAHNDPIKYIDPTGHKAAVSSNGYVSSGTSLDKFLSNIINPPSPSKDKYKNTKLKEYANGPKKKTQNSSSSSSSNNSSKTNNTNSSSSSGSSSDDRPRYNNIPADMDWDRDGRVDTKEDKAKFDSNGNGIADWNEDKYADSWVYDSSEGWKHAGTGNVSTNAPTARQIREVYDQLANMSSQPTDYYTDANVPKYEHFRSVTDAIVGFVETTQGMRTKYKDGVIVLADTGSTDGGVGGEEAKTADWKIALAMGIGYVKTTWEYSQEVQSLLLPGSDSLKQGVAFYQFAWELVDGTITLDTILAALEEQYVYPFEYLYQNADHVFNGDPDWDDAYEYGVQGAKAVQALAEVGIAVGTIGRGATRGAAKQLEEMAKRNAAKVTSEAAKGMGDALVKDTGSISKNTANLRTWAEKNGWVRQDTAGGVEQWGVKNADGTFSWRLKLKPEASTREGLGAGSNQPRFDARLDDKGTYINPFTGETGGRSVGTHIPLGE